MSNRTRTYKTKIWVLTALCLVSTSALAELKIGVVNFARLLDESPQAQNAMQSLQDEFAPRQREIVARQTELRTREESLQKDRDVMAEAERRNAERDLRDGQRELARRQNEYIEDLDLRRNEELGRLQRSLVEEVQAYARTAGYDLIVGDNVLFASEAVDITSQILSGLEASYRASQTDGN